MPVPKHMSTPGYGFEDVKRLGRDLPWEEVEARLRDERNYWVSTTGRDGHPHAAPVWGVWLNGCFVFETSSESAKARNLMINPNVVVHPDHGAAAVILEGVAGLVDRDDPLIAAFAAAYDAKYDWDIDQYLSRPVSATFRVTPRCVMAFREHLGTTAARWEFT